MRNREILMALRRSEANLAKAQQIAHLGSYEINVPFDDNDYRSNEIFRIIGVQPAQAGFSTEKYIKRFIHPADRERYTKIVEHAIRHGQPFDFEYRVLRPDGAVRYVHSVGEPVLNTKGRVIKLVGTLQDITERKELENALLEISDREQRRIGQDLHDGLGQHLAGIELMGQVLEQNLAAKRLKAEAAHAGELARHVRDAIGQTRSLARGLVPVVLESEGLMSALKDLAENTEKIFNITCRFECRKSVLVHDPNVATQLYRIAQEAVSNAIKHGKAKKIRIVLQNTRDQIRLLVRDDGAGIPKQLLNKSGMGLRIMQYRAGTMGATLTVERDPAGGTSVVCSLAKANAGKK
jgi:PAS domain S-box-containing protein